MATNTPRAAAPVPSDGSSSRVDRQPAQRPPLEVLGQWSAEEGSTAQGLGGWEYQITAVRLGAAVGFVRTKLEPFTPSFLMSAGARWGQKHGRCAGVQVFYLAAPDEVWDQIAEQIRATEARDAGRAKQAPRPVLRNLAWTERRARECIKKDSSTVRFVVDGWSP